MYDYIREMTDYEISDFIINVFNMGRVSMLEEMSDKENVGVEFDVNEFISSYSSMYSLN